MQAKRKLAALLLSLCMVLGVLPMTAFAAGVPAAPTNLKLEVTADGLKVSWDKPASTGGLDIFEYEVTLYGHFDGIAGGKTEVETKTVQRETTCTFTNTGNAEGVINPNYEVEVKAREGVSGTGDPDNLGNYHVTEWTDWSNASTVSLDWNEVTFNTTINNYYTGVVDVGLPGSENKLYQEGITATGNPDVIKPDGTTSENEKQAVTELLYQYFEKNKATVPELANVTRDNLMVKTVLERIESSRTIDPDNYQIIVYEVVDKYYTLYLEFNPETEIVQPDTTDPTEPTDPTDPTTPTDPTEPTDPAKPEQQGKPSGQTESPQTGDSSDMALWIGLMLASCGGVLGMLFYRRKKAAAEK